MSFFSPLSSALSSSIVPLAPILDFDAPVVRMGGREILICSAVALLNIQEENVRHGRSSRPIYAEEDESIYLSIKLLFCFFSFLLPLVLPNPFPSSSSSSSSSIDFVCFFVSFLAASSP